MIAYINGILAEVQPDCAVIDVGGVGYLIHISATTADRMPGIGEMVKLHTFMSVREDSMTLFGFLSHDELETFQLLISVNGIGPKGALAILSALPVDDLRFAVLAGDVKAIARAPGIGKKTAERLVLDLKDKFGSAVYEGGDGAMVLAGDLAGTETHPVRDEAVAALVALGYAHADAMRAVRNAYAAANDETIDTETLLKAALKELV